MSFIKNGTKSQTLEYLFQAAVIGICCWFVLLCTVHYLRQRPLWLDEQSVFKSVETYQSADFFTKKLAVDQIFPRFHLFLIQKIAQPFGLHLLSLRFLSFVSMLTAFLLWLRIAGYEFKQRSAYLVFIFSWVASVPLIYYSAELKQYSMDVCAAALFLSFLYQQERLAQGHRPLYLLILALLPLLGLFSYPAFLFFIFPFYNLLSIKPHDRWQKIALSIYLVSAMFAVTFVYLFDVRVAHANSSTQGYGNYVISFQSVGDFLNTFGEGTMNLFSRWFTEQPRVFKKISIAFMAFGLLYIPYGFWRGLKKGIRLFDSVELVAFILYLELFLLGALGRYPFSVPRTSLFYCPIVILMAIKGMGVLRNWNPSIYRVIFSLYVIFLSVVAVGITKVVLTQNLGAIQKIW